MTFASFRAANASGGYRASTRLITSGGLMATVCDGTVVGGGAGGTGGSCAKLCVQTQTAQQAAPIAMRALATRRCARFDEQQAGSATNFKDGSRHSIRLLRRA